MFSIQKAKKIGFLMLVVGLGGLSTGFASAALLQVMERHFQLADPSLVTPVLNPSVQNTQQRFTNTDLRFVLEEIETFMNTDLTQLLASANPQRALDDYLIDGANLTQALNYHYLKQESQLSADKNRLDLCQSQLSSANASYKTALSTHQESLYNAALSQAKKARTCIGESTVMVSSLSSLNAQIAAYRTAINKRTSYLVTNKYKILENIDMLDSKKLAELQSITAALYSTKK